MPRPTTTRSTTFALLALMGLVGGLGAGLHSLVHVIGGRVDCWWYGASPCCVVQADSQPAGEAAVGDGSDSFKKLATDGHADCPICTLLTRFHAPPATAAIHATTALLHVNVAVVDPFFLSRATPSAHRPRGPPCWN